MGSVISSLCHSQEEEKIKKMEESLIRREVRAEVIQPKSHLKRDNSYLVPEKSCLSGHVVKQNYSFLDEVGKGTYGKVHKAQLNVDMSKKRLFAVKTIEKTLHQKEIRRFLREIEILKTLDHPNVIRFYEAYESPSSYFIIQEFCGGGDLGRLFEIQSGGFKESDARDYMWQIFLALNYLHKKGIAHRDIKPENFLITDHASSQLKLIDFGLSATLNSSYETLKETCGSPFYLAPEVLEKDYTPLCDVWSAGVVLFNFMTCGFPFEDENNEKLFQKIKAIDYNRELIESLDYSSESKHLLSRLLIRESAGRLSAAEALQHPWFAVKREEVRAMGEKYLQADLLQQLREYCYTKLLQREMISLVVQETDLNDPEILRLHHVFRYIDSDLSGTISAAEIEAVYRKFDIKLREGEIEEIIDSLYFKEPAVVTYLEFIAATLDKEFYRNKQRIRELFNYIDVDLSGEIDYQDIQDCFKRFGRLLDDAKIRRMIDECDVNKDQKISFEEFYEIIVADRKKVHPAS